MGLVLVLAAGVFATPAAATTPGAIRGLPQTSGTPAADPDPLLGAPTDPVTALNVETNFDEVTLTWRNPTQADWAETIVRIAPGTELPSTPEDGYPLYNGREAGATVTELGLGEVYTFAFFARDLEGLVSAPAYRTVGGAQVTLAASQRSVTYGKSVTIEGNLTDSQFGQDLAYQTIHLFAYDATTDEAREINSTSTSRTGVYELTLTPKRNYQYSVLYYGDNHLLGGASPIVPISVLSTVTAKAASSTVAKGAKISITGKTKPAGRVSFVLQRKVGGAWQNVARQKSSAKGTTSFTVKAKKTGTYTYRVKRASTPDIGGGVSKPVQVRVR